MRKVGRALAALILASSPFLWPLSSSATDSVQNAQAAVDAAILEESEAQSLKAYTDALVDSSTIDRDIALSDVMAAQLDYDNSNVEVGRNTTNGLTATSFNTFGTPVRSLSAYQPCAINQVSHVYDFWPQGCNQDGMIHFQGVMTPTVTGKVWFLGASDDGMQIVVNGSTVSNYWGPQGCRANNSSSVDLVAGTPYSFEVWFFDSGGPSCAITYYRLDSQNFWQEIPASWFSGTTIIYGKDPTLLEALNTKKATLDSKQEILDSAVYLQAEAEIRLQAAIDDLVVANQILAEAIAEAERLAEEEAAKATPEPTPTEPSPEPTPEPSQTEQPVLPEPTPTVTAEPSPEPSPSTSIDPTPEPSQSPEPSPGPLPSEEPSPVESETPGPTPSETKTPEAVEPTLEPTPVPTETTPTPGPTVTPQPQPQPTPEPTPSEPKFIIPSDTKELIKDLLNVDPEIISLEQLEEIKEMVYEVFGSVEPGSEEYQEALGALAVLAQVDDLELSEELAAIPLIGDVAGAVLDTFNALGNVGADMSPKVREQSEDVIVAAVIVGQVAITATTAAASAAAVASRRI